MNNNFLSNMGRLLIYSSVVTALLSLLLSPGTVAQNDASDADPAVSDTMLNDSYNVTSLTMEHSDGSSMHH